MLNKDDIKEGRDIIAIMAELNDEGKRIVNSFAEGALKMQEIYKAKEMNKAAG